jgi:hypothetical protein
MTTLKDETQNWAKVFLEGHSGAARVINFNAHLLSIYATILFRRSSFSSQSWDAPCSSFA